MALHMYESIPLRFVLLRVHLLSSAEQHHSPGDHQDLVHQVKLGSIIVSYVSARQATNCLYVVRLALNRL